jgi:homoserine O-acetyltransferase
MTLLADRTRLDLELDCGRSLSDVQLAFHAYGDLAGAKEATLVLHALTGDSAVHSWWPGLLGRGRALDFTERPVLCSNVLGGCAGTTGPRELGPFQVSVADMVRLQVAWIRSLGIRRLRLIGGSMGGMQALEWLRQAGDLVESAVIIAAPRKQTPWARAFNLIAQQAIESDPGYSAGCYQEQPAGLALARQLAILSYRTPQSINAAQAGESPVVPGEEAIASYLWYQGEKLRARFDANSYLMLTRAMDAFEVPESALRSVAARCLVIGVSSDLLYPAAELRQLASLLPRSEYCELESPHGHDAFLIAQDQVSERVARFFA